MTTSTPPDNTVLVLYPPKVNGQTTPVVGAHIGVPLVASDLVADGKGAVVIVDPPLSGTMDPGDVMELWLEGESATLDSETITNPNAKTQLRTKGRLHPDKVNKMYYTVRRGSDNIGTSTPSLEILYNRIRPGLKDRFPQIDGHSELDLDLSDLIKQGVGKDFVSAPVCFSYPYCRAYDTISLKCNGEIETFPVSKDQAPEPPNPGTEVPTTVCFTVEREFLDKAKRQNKVLNFSYSVTDQLLNGPDPDAVWSAAVAVNEDLDGTLLDTPILREIAGDTADEPGIIDLKKLGSNPLLVYISTVDPRFEPGDKIEATYTAKIAGQDDKTVVLTGQVETDDIGNKITCVLKVLNKDVIVATSVSVKYKLLRKLDDTLKAESNIATATVVGDYMELKPASVQQANGNTLAPMAAVSKLTIVVPQGTTLPTDLLSVSWIPEPGTHAEGTYISNPRPISEVGLNVDAPPALVAFCLGGRVTVSYTITRGNGQPQPSDPFILNVQELPQAELIAPRLKEASNAGEGSELNLAELTPEGKMWCSGFPFNAVGQYVWLLFKGTNADDSTYEKYIWAAPFAFVNDDWVRNGYFEATAPYEDLKGLKDGTPLTIEMSVAFGKSLDLGLAKRFVLRTYIVSAVEDVRPTITSVKGLPSENEIPENESTSETAITLSGGATKGQQVEVFDGTESKGKATAIETGVWSYPDKDLAEGDHSYKVKALYGSEQVSAARNLKVVSALSVDTSPVKLFGQNYTVDLAAVGWELTGTDLPNTAVSRAATGGKAPYTYISSAPGTASVDDTGRIRSEGNGEATITVSDTLGQSREIPVEVSNVQRILYGGTNLSHAAAQSWMVSVGGSPFPPDRMDLSQFNQKFRVLIAGNPTDRYYFPGRYLPSSQVGLTWVQYTSVGMGPFRSASSGSANAIPYIALCIARAD